jgi:tripartite motif-containing protein 71
LGLSLPTTYAKYFLHEKGCIKKWRFWRKIQVLLILIFNCFIREAKSEETYQLVTTWGTHGSGNGQFDYIGGVAVDTAGHVYVAEINNNRIQKFTTSGTFISKWSNFVAFGDFWDVAVDTSGNIFAVDDLNCHVIKYNPSGTRLTYWGSYGSGNGQFYEPVAVAVDSYDNVYVVDSHSLIKKFNSEGVYITQWGSYGSSDGQFNNPQGIAVDRLSNVYVVDKGNNRIQKFTSNGTFISKWVPLGLITANLRILIGWQ